MNNLKLIAIMASGCLIAVTDVGAKEKAKRGKTEATSTAVVEKGGEKPKEPWVDVKVVIGHQEREVIQTYAKEKHAAKALPPGLAKKVARGGSLPPGWKKKVVPGQIMPEDVFKHCHRLPDEIVAKLPAPPKGTILIAVGGKIVRLLEATREILDVFDVRF